jgi:beta-ribofuranosylaminobenzene 5'-phosphate synthase
MNGNKTVYIKANPRIHVTLIAMNNKGLRINGGFGFSIQEPSLQIIISKSAIYQLEDQRDLPLDSSQRLRLKEKVESVKGVLNLDCNIHINIKGDLPVHSGFGSGTIIRLACLEALFIINDFKYTKEDLIKMSGRGGTSGIGVRTYFNGGYVFDAGHKNKGQKLQPSSKKELNSTQSLLISTGAMPPWALGVCYPILPLATTETEDAFFAKNTNIENSDIYETLYHVTHGILSGIMESDFDCFQQAINSIQKSKWKKLERDLYSGLIDDYERVLYKNGATAVGMSSLGPGLTFWGSDIESVIKNSQQEMPNWRFFSTLVNNLGRELVIKDA